MELMELSTQLKTFDIMDSQNPSPPDRNKTDAPIEENRRLTRSRTMPKSDIWTPLAEYPVHKNPKKVLDPEDELRQIYLNTKVKIVHKNLETIFEDPIVRKGNTMFLGVGKQKRSLYLCREFRTTTKQKSKIRKSKIKRLGKRGKPFKMSDDEFREKMMRIDNFINSNDIQENGIEENNGICLTESNSEMETP